MSGGRKPKPTALHRLHGTYEPSRHDARATEISPEGELSELEPPDWMSDEQKAVWRDIIARVPFGVMRKLDCELFVSYVMTWVRFRDAAIAQNKLDHGKQFPFISVGPNKLPVKSKYVGIMNRASLLLLRYGHELGFGPSGRARLASDGFSPAKPPEEATSWGRLRRFGVLDGGKRA